MGNFNPGLNPTNDPQYNGGKEYTAADFPNQAAELKSENEMNLFKGLLKGAGEAVETGYRHVTNEIKDMVYDGVDKLRDAQGVGDAVYDAESQAGIAAGVSKPPNADEVQNSVKRLHTAFEQGKISDTNYYAQLEAMTRSIRSRFPGFRDEVDAMVHSVTGIVPANALRSSILHELSKAQDAQDAQGKEFRSFVKQNLEHLPSDYWDRANSGKPYSEQETYAYVTKSQQNDHKITTDKALIEKSAAENRLTDEQAESTARDNVAILNNKVLAQARPFLDEMLDAQSKGKVFSPEEQNVIRARLAKYRSDAEMSLNEYFDKPLTPGSGKTMGGYVKDKRKGIIGDSLQIFDTLDKAIATGDNAVLKTAANTIKAQQEATSLEILKKYPTLAAVSEISKSLGPAGAGVLQKIIDLDPTTYGTLNSETKALLQGQQLAIMTKGRHTPDGRTSIDQQMNDFLASPEGKKPAAVKAKVQSLADVVANPNLPEEHLRNAADVLFGDPSNLKFLDRFNDASKLSVFQSLVSPAVTKNMQKIGGEQWKNYSLWAKNAFTAVYRSAGANVGQSPDAPFWKVSFNESSNRFVLEPTPEGIRFVNQQGRAATGYTIIQALSRLTGSNVQASVDKINNGISLIEPVLKAEGHNTHQEIMNLTGFMSKYDTKNPNFWQWIMKSAAPKAGEDKAHHEETFGGVHPNFTQASGASLSLEEPDKAIDAIKGAFSAGESGNNYNRLVSGRGTPKEAALTSMTVRDVLAYQEGMLHAGHLSTAAGKYQILKGTLRSLVDEGHIRLTDMYNETTQEKAAEALLERRGLTGYLEGKIPLAKFMHNLGNEWEIIKKSPEAYYKTMRELQKLKDTKVASQ